MWQNELPALQGKKITSQPVPVHLGGLHSCAALGALVPCSHLGSATRRLLWIELKEPEERRLSANTDIMWDFHLEARRLVLFVGFLDRVGGVDMLAHKIRGGPVSCPLWSYSTLCVKAVVFNLWVAPPLGRLPLSDSYVVIHNSSKITVMKEQRRLLHNCNEGSPHEDLF